MLAFGPWSAEQIQPRLGASAYGFSPQALETIPQGAGAPLNQVLLRAPGVAQDSFGQLHVRGDHANLQFRLNGVQLPEGLSVFGQAIDLGDYRVDIQPEEITTSEIAGTLVKVEIKGQTTFFFDRFERS